MARRSIRRDYLNQTDFLAACARACVASRLRPVELAFECSCESGAIWKSRCFQADRPKMLVKLTEKRANNRAFAAGSVSVIFHLYKATN